MSGWTCRASCFVYLLLGLILEGHIWLLWLAPPCGTFSVALNKFGATMLWQSTDLAHGARTTYWCKDRNVKECCGQKVASSYRPGFARSCLLPFCGRAPSQEDRYQAGNDWRGGVGPDAGEFSVLLSLNGSAPSPSRLVDGTSPRLQLLFLPEFSPADRTCLNSPKRPGADDRSSSCSAPIGAPCRHKGSERTRARCGGIGGEEAEGT